MKSLAKPAILGFLIISTALPSFAAHRFYVGIGGSGNTINENFDSTIFDSTNKGAYDSYNINTNQLAPMLQAGYWSPQQKNWLWGIVAQWKYLNYTTANVDSSSGQHLPNSTFSSANFFGNNVDRDFTSQTRINNEFLLLFYAGMPLMQGYAYLGIGPSLLTATNHIYLNSVHVPNGTGDTLISTSVNNNQTMWGGAVQMGYNYFFNPFWFLNINYTYLQTANVSFTNAINSAMFNGANTPGPTSLTLNRNISVRTQEVMISINRVFLL
jgi:outer membrane protein W